MMKVTILTLSLVISLTGTQIAEGVDCKDVIDIGILIDASASMGEEWLVSAMAFAIQLTDNFTISYDETRFALISFSSEAKAEFHFKDYTTQGEIQLALGKIDFQNASTRIDKALGLAYTDIFTENSGTRTGASRFLVIATDGRFLQNGLPTFHSLILPITGLKIEVFVVGIGNEVVMSDLRALALNKTENVFPTPSDLHRDNLINRIRHLTNTKCGSPVRR